MKILIIPEDPTHDPYILKPIVTKIFDELGMRVRMDVLRDPHLSGISQALNKETLARIVDDNRMIDFFLLMVDRDCERYENTRKASEREKEHPGKLLACLAVEEVETWLLALFKKELEPGWAEIRKDCDPKDRYFNPFIGKKGWRSSPGQGRKKGMRQLAGQWKSLQKLCPEIGNFKERLQKFFFKTQVY